MADHWLLKGAGPRRENKQDRERMEVAVTALRAGSQCQEGYRFGTVKRWL